MEKIIVIGAGPAGMSAALSAKNKFNEVTILERNNNCGKKLLITGAGKCNYLNEDFSIKHYRSNNISKLEKFITKENKNRIKDFFFKLGIEPKVRNGYYYPNSQTSISVQNAFLLELKNKEIEVLNNKLVEKIIKIDDSFIITTNNSTYKCDKVIVAAGSKAAPKTGSDGSIFNILRELNIELVNVKPALVQLKSSDRITSHWAGIRVDAQISLLSNNKLIKEEDGELQLTDYGISGICTLQLSSDAIKLINTDLKVRINFVPNISNFDSWIEDRNEKLKNRNIIELLEGVVNYKLLYALLKEINVNKTYGDLNNVEKNIIKKQLTSFDLEINGFNDFDKAQVCQGGISLDEVDDNFEVSKFKHLYAVGEVLDVDGDCGGYNIGFAVLSGLIAGESAGKK